MTCQCADMSLSLPEAVRAKRKECGLTIEALAFRSGRSVATIQRIETGKHAPSLGTLADVADALEVGVDELLGTTAEVSS